VNHQKDVKIKASCAPRRSRSPPATRATAPSPSPLRATSTSTNRFSAPSRQNACLCPAAASPAPDAAAIRAQRSCSTVTNAALRCAYRASRCTARCSANRAGSKTCGDTLAKSAIRRQKRAASTLILQFDGWVGGGEEGVLEDEKPPYS